MILIWAYLWIFCICFFGERVTNAFEDLEHTVYQCDWYLFPREIQKFVPTIMINVQQPVNIRIFGKFNCTLRTFKQVISFYFQIKTFNEFGLLYISFQIITTSYQYFATLREII